MSAGTKVSVAIVVLFVSVLGIYYGFGGPDGAGPLPAELLPPAEEDPIIEADPVGESARAAQDTTGGDLARTIEEALWSQGGATTDIDAAMGVLGSDAVSAVSPPDDPWVLRAPTLMPEPESRPVPAGTPRTPRTVEYVVQPDDSMWTIAQRWFGDPNRWREIAGINPDINPDRLQVGQRLQLPARDDTSMVNLNSAAAIPAGSTMPVPAGSGRYYTVRAGDTLSTIAESQYRAQSRWREIYQANRTAIGGSPDRLKVGLKLRIP